METKTMDFSFNGTPLKVEIYIHEPTLSTRTKMTGVDFSRPLNISELYGLQEVLERVIFEAERMERD